MLVDTLCTNTESRRLYDHLNPQHAESILEEATPLTRPRPTPLSGIIRDEQREDILVEPIIERLLPRGAPNTGTFPKFGYLTALAVTCRLLGHPDGILTPPIPKRVYSTILSPSDGISIGL